MCWYYASIFEALRVKAQILLSWQNVKLRKMSPIIRDVCCVYIWLKSRNITVVSFDEKMSKQSWLITLECHSDHESRYLSSVHFGGFLHSHSDIQRHFSFTILLLHKSLSKLTLLRKIKLNPRCLTSLALIQHHLLHTNASNYDLCQKMRPTHFQQENTS